MIGRRHVLVIAGGLGLAAACLALGGVLDSPALAAAGALSAVFVVVASDVWLEGGIRKWLLLMGSLLAVVVVAFVVQTLAG